MALPACCSWSRCSSRAAAAGRARRVRRCRRCPGFTPRPPSSPSPPPRGLFWLNLRQLSPLAARSRCCSPLAGSAVALTARRARPGRRRRSTPCSSRRAAAGSPPRLVVLAAAAAVVRAPGPAAAARGAPGARARSPRRRSTPTRRDHPGRRSTGSAPSRSATALARGAPARASRQIVRRGAHGPLATLRPTEGAAHLDHASSPAACPRDHGVKSFADLPAARARRRCTSCCPRARSSALLERAPASSRPSPVTVGLAQAPRALERAQRLRHPGRDRARLGHAPAGAHPGLHALALLPPPAARSGAGADTLHPPRPAARGAGARRRARRTWTARCSREFVDLSVGCPGGRACPGGASSWSARSPPTSPTSARDAVLRAAYDPPFFATYFYGLDSVGHTFIALRATRSASATCGPRSAAATATCVDALHRATSRSCVGELVQAPAARARSSSWSPATACEPMPPWRRAWEALIGDPLGERRPTPTPRTACSWPWATGSGRGRRCAAPRCSTSRPTILYLMGLPVARDMEGRVLTEMLEERLRARAPRDLHPELREPGRDARPRPRSRPGCRLCPDEAP